jgi:hypothetical protein
MECAGMALLAYHSGRKTPEFGKGFFFRANDARMLLKTKGRSGRLAGKAGMYMKTKKIQGQNGNVVENKGG